MITDTMINPITERQDTEIEVGVESILRQQVINEDRNALVTDLVAANSLELSGCTNTDGCHGGNHQGNT